MSYNEFQYLITNPKEKILITFQNYQENKNKTNTYLILFLVFIINNKTKE